MEEAEETPFARGLNFGIPRKSRLPEETQVWRKPRRGNADGWEPEETQVWRKPKFSELREVDQDLSEERRASLTVAARRTGKSAGHPDSIVLSLKVLEPSDFARRMMLSIGADSEDRLAAPGRAGFREVAPKTVSDVVSGPVTAAWQPTGLPDRQGTESELHRKLKPTPKLVF